MEHGLSNFNEERRRPEYWKCHGEGKVLGPLSFALEPGVSFKFWLDTEGDLRKKPGLLRGPLFHSPSLPCAVSPLLPHRSHQNQRGCSSVVSPH